MASAERAVLIRTGCKEAFALLSDFRNDSRWRRFVQEVEHAPPGLAWLGTRVHETVLLFGMRIHGECEVVEYEQDRWIVTRPVTGRPGLCCRREVTPHAEGCRCSVSLEFQLEGWVRMLGRLPELVLRRRLPEDLLRLKKILEHPEPSVRPPSRVIGRRTEGP